MEKIFPDGDEIITSKSQEGEGVKVEALVPATGEKVYEATYSQGSKKPSMEWFGPNYTRYDLFNQ